MKKIDPQKLMDLYKALPDDVAAVYEGADTATTLLDIGKKYGLAIDKIGRLTYETGLVLVGASPAREYVDNLEEELGVPRDVALDIGREVNHRLFARIRESLRTIHRVGANTSLIPEESLGRPPSQRPPQAMTPSQPLSNRPPLPKENTSNISSKISMDEIRTPAAGAYWDVVRSASQTKESVSIRTKSNAPSPTTPTANKISSPDQSSPIKISLPIAPPKVVDVAPPSNLPSPNIGNPLAAAPAKEKGAISIPLREVSLENEVKKIIQNTKPEPEPPVPLSKEGVKMPDPISKAPSVGVPTEGKPSENKMREFTTAMPTQTPPTSAPEKAAKEDEAEENVLKESSVPQSPEVPAANEAPKSPGPAASPSYVDKDPYREPID